MTIKLWGRATSLNVQKVIWALEELGMPFERFDVGGAYGGLDTDSYGVMNPNRRVPTLQDGDLFLWESNVIVRYLAEAHGRGRLRPQELRDAATADQWMDWMQTTLLPVFMPLFWEAVRKPPSLRDQGRVSQLAKEAGEVFGLVEARLRDVPWLAGPAFSMGDIPVGSTLYRWFSLDIERPDLPRLSDWYERLGERPAYRSSVMTTYEPLRGRD